MVYRAHQSVVTRDVAIKVVSPKYANQPEFIRRFESEAQVVARLEHPHIVPLYDFWREPDSTCLVMRYLRAGSLRDLIEREGKLDIALTAKIVEQVGSALNFAHNSGVVHQDIKADNIFLDDDAPMRISATSGSRKRWARTPAMAQTRLLARPLIWRRSRSAAKALGPRKATCIRFWHNAL